MRENRKFYQKSILVILIVIALSFTIHYVYPYLKSILF
jgi:hypothetical protein